MWLCAAMLKENQKRKIATLLRTLTTLTLLNYVQSVC